MAPVRLGSRLIAHVHELVGWTPIALDLESGAPWVEWTDLDARGFDEPFFEQTLREHLAKPGSRRARSDAEALAVIGARCDSVGPSGFVFHGSRCGSTALAHALAAIKGVLVVREPITLGRALLQRHAEPDDARVRGLVRTLLQRRRPEQRHGFIKLSSYAVLFAGSLRTLFPAVPCMFVYRDPLEVAVSLIERPPSWAALLRSGALGIPAEQLPARAEGPEGLVAFAIGAMYRAALACGPVELVVYPELAHGCASSIARTFGLVLDDDDVAAIAATLGHDAKQPTRAFTPDGAAKRRQASPMLRAAIERHALEPWLALESTRLRHAAERAHAGEARCVGVGRRAGQRDVELRR